MKDKQYCRPPPLYKDGFPNFTDNLFHSPFKPSVFPVRIVYISVLK